jgi:LacI family transcriptional regulator
MRSGRPTIKDVAKQAGVSFKTVSRVINGQSGVRDEVRARVREAVAELGYVVNYSARSLASGHSRALGVVIPRITDPYTFEMIHHVGEVSERLKLGVVILTRPTLSDELSMSNFVGHGMVGALLLVSPKAVEAYLPTITALRIPTVVIETPFVDPSGALLDAPLPYVVSDNRRGAAEGVAYLVALGHRRIAFITGRSVSQNLLRLLGYQDAIAAHGLPLVPDYVRPGRWTWESGYDEALALWRLPEPPTAIFCANDSMALGAMHALTAHGVRVPEDVSILGFDDISAGMQSTPPLSTVKQPAFEMVQTAFDILIRAMDNKPLAATHQILPTTLVVRGSCAPPPRT